MNTYVKTTSGDIFKVWSDNVREETMDVYPCDELFDVHSTNCKSLHYSEVVATDTNLSVLSDYKY